MVSSIPGPSAALAGLTGSGLPTDAFLFAGFLPAKSGPRRTRLEELRTVPATLVFFETAPRLGKSLADMAAVLGPREAALAKELTKLHETFRHGRLDQIAEEMRGEIARGEFVVVVAPPAPQETEIADAKIAAELERVLREESFRDAVRTVADRLGVKRSRVYALGLTLRSGNRK
jgi:16S rRNA (cytidine1402-2'-O)-methyltransferase